MARTYLYLFLFLVLVQPLHSQKTKFKTGIPSPRSFFTEIPYEEVNGKIVIPVTIKNKTYRFLFDTGAPNVISSKIYERLNVENSKSISVNDANNKKQEMQIALIPQLSIGNVSFKNSSSLVFNDDNNLVFNCFEIDGIIGTNLLRKSLVQILPKEKTIVITNQHKKRNLDKTKAIDLELRGSQSSPYISIKLQGENKAKERLLIDTGASGLYDMCKKNYTLLKEKEILVKLGSSSGASSLGLFGEGEASIQYRLKVPLMTIANHDFKNVITITGNDDNSRIGSDILKHGEMTLDFKNKRFYFNGFEKESDLNEKLFGFTPTIANSKVIVGLVWNEDLKRKIKYGDEILRINNADYSDFNLCDLLTIKSPFKETETIKLSIKKEADEIIELNLSRE